MGNTAAPRTSGLSVLALVLACLLVLPLVPLVGAILGIVALARARPGEPRGLAIAAIPIGVAGTLLIQPFCAAIAIPSFVKYTHRAVESEARANVRMLADTAAAWSEAHPGQRLPSSAGWTPAENACDKPGRKIAVDARAWAAPPWGELDFAPSEPLRFQYRVVSSPAELRIEARADTGCDGDWRLLSRTVTGTTVGPLETARTAE